MFLPFFPIFCLKSRATKCLLWCLPVSCVGAASEQQMGVVWLQPISQGEKTLRNSSLAGSVGFCNGSRPTPGQVSQACRPALERGWLTVTQPRGHPHSLVPCSGAVPSLFWGLDNPKDQRCRRERATSQTRAGVSARSAAPHRLGLLQERRLSLQCKVF